MSSDQWRDLVIVFLLKYHKHVSGGDVFVHHEPGIPLSSYPRPLAQGQSEPAWTNTNMSGKVHNIHKNTVEKIQSRQ